MTEERSRAEIRKPSSRETDPRKNDLLTPSMEVNISRVQILPAPSSTPPQGRSGDSIKDQLASILCFGKPSVSYRVITGYSSWITHGPPFIAAARQHSIIAIDTESIGRAPNHEIVLIQLAIPSGQSLIIRIRRLKPIPKDLIQLLQRPVPMKIGIAVKEDVVAKLNTRLTT